MIIRKKNPKIVLILTGIAFFASGIDCIENNLIFIGVSSLLVAILNIGASLVVKKHPFNTKIILNIINAVFAALSSYFYYQTDRDIKYGWAVVFIAYLIAIAVAYRKRIKSKNTVNNQIGINERIQ